MAAEQTSETTLFAPDSFTGLSHPPTAEGSIYHAPEEIGAIVAAFMGELETQHPGQLAIDDHDQLDLSHITE